MYISLHVKYPIFLSDFSETLIFKTYSKNTQRANFMIIRPVGDQIFHAKRDGQSDTEMTELIIAFPNFTDGPKNASFKFKSQGSL